MLLLRLLLAAFTTISFLAGALEAADVPVSITPVGDDLEVEVDVKRLAFSPDGKSLLLGTDGVYWLSDVPEPKLRAPGIQGPSAVTGMDRPPNEKPVIGGRYMAAEAAEFTTDGKTLLVTTFQTLQRWDVSKSVALGKAVKLPAIIQSDAMAINPATGDLFLVSNWELFDGLPEARTQTPVIGISMNPGTGKTIGKPIRFDAKPWPGERRHWGIQQVRFSPDGKLLAVQHDNGVVKLWDVPAAKELVPAGLTEAIDTCHIQWSPDGKRLLVHNTKGAQLWDPIALKPVGDLIKTAGDEGGNSILIETRASFSSDSSTLATTAFAKNGRGHDIQFVNAETGKVKSRFTFKGTGPGKYVRHLQYVGLNLLILTESTGKDLPWLWEPTAGKPLAAPSKREFIHLAAVSPDQKHLATYFYNGSQRTIRMWKLP